MYPNVSKTWKMSRPIHRLLMQRRLPLASKLKLTHVLDSLQGEHGGFTVMDMFVIRRLFIFQVGFVAGRSGTTSIQSSIGRPFHKSFTSNLALALRTGQIFRTVAQVFMLSFDLVFFKSVIHSETS